jgi:uncharacterized protein (TIGR02246 family)
VIISNASERTALEATIFEYFRALNDSNVDPVLELYTKDPVMLPFLQPTVTGIEAVRKNYENTFLHIRFQVQTRIQELVEMSPEWAYVHTDSAGTFTPTRTGVGSPSTFLLRETSDGKWHIARYSFSPAAELPAI